MTTRARFFLVLAVIGFVVPNVMLGFHLADEGVSLDSLGEFAGDVVETLPATQILVDISIVAATLLAWASWEGPRLGIRRWWLIFPATAFVGLCFGAPLFLYQRERALAATSGPAR